MTATKDSNGITLLEGGYDSYYSEICKRYVPLQDLQADQEGRLLKTPNKLVS